MDSDNILVTTLTLLFGVLIGIMSVASLLYFAGLVSLGDNPQQNRVSTSATPGMDRLETYPCLQSETKLVILGGKEDNFAAGDEEAAAAPRFLARWGDFPDAVPETRSYDEDGTDKMLIDAFKFPSTTASGLFVFKARALSSLKNDGISMGDIFGNDTLGHVFTAPLQDLEKQTGWQRDGLLFSADLAGISFNQDGNAPVYSNVLSLVQSGPGETTIEVNISDDTQVDFIGFALCLGPDIKKGTRYVAADLDLPQGFANLSCRDRSGQFDCDVFRGDLQCDLERPVACFKPDNMERPSVLDDFPDARPWSGGQLKLSPNVRGDTFSTADDVHAFCRANFGKDWRMMTFSEGGPARRVIASGEIPVGSEAWVDVPSQPHANCWTQRPGYN